MERHNCRHLAALWIEDAMFCTGHLQIPSYICTHSKFHTGANSKPPRCSLVRNTSGFSRNMLEGISSAMAGSQYPDIQGNAIGQDPPLSKCPTPIAIIGMGKHSATIEERTLT